MQLLFLFSSCSFSHNTASFFFFLLLPAAMMRTDRRLQQLRCIKKKMGINILASESLMRSLSNAGVNASLGKMQAWAVISYVAVAPFTPPGWLAGWLAYIH